MGTSEILTFGGLVFLAVFLLSQGLVLPVMGESKAARKRLKQRLNDLESNDDEGITSLLRQNNLKRLSPFERRLEELPWLHRLGTVIEQSGNNIPAYRLVAVAFVLSLVCGTVCWQLTHALDITPLVVLAGFALPFMKISRDRGARFAKLEEQLPDAIDTIQRALKAGHPFSATLKMVAEDMDQPIAREF